MSKINNNLSNFLTMENFEKSELFKKMHCNKTDFELMRYIIRFSLESNATSFIINYILQDFNNEIKNKNNKEDFDFEMEQMDEVQDIIKNNVETLTEVEENMIKDFQKSLKNEEFKNNFDYIKYIKNMKNLIGLGWVFVDNEGNNYYDDYSFLNKRVYISKEFLELMHDGDLKTNEVLENSAYKNYDEYLNDQFLYIDNLIVLNRLQKFGIEPKKSPIFKNFKEYNKKLEKSIQKRSMNNLFFNKLLNFEKENELNKNEKLILISLIKQEYFTEQEQYIDIENDLSFLITEDQRTDSSEFRKFIYSSNLYKNGIVKIDKAVNPLTGLLSYLYYIEENYLIQLGFENNSIEDHETDRVKKIQLFYNSVKSSPIFEIIDTNITLNEVILNSETEEILKNLIKQTNKSVSDRLVQWGIKKESVDVEAKIIFHGKPGTGKTLAAVAFSNSIGKKIISFDCSKLLSMYVGESEKNVREIFDSYNKIVKETGIKPVLLLNEADQFLSKRSENPGGGSDQMHNQMQNIFLEQIEKFDGIIIATTNLIDNIDKAFSRRFNYKIEFKTPTKLEREKIWNLHLPKTAEFEKDFEVEKLSSFELTGGQINLIIKNTAYKVAVREEDLVFKNNDFIEEINKEIKSNFENDKKIVGFKN